MPKPSQEIVGAIQGAADKNGVPFSTLYAYAQTESQFNVSAVSNTGVNGLFQITRDTWGRYSDQPYSKDASQQADVAARIIKDNLGQFKDPSLAAVAYNAGGKTAGLAQKYIGQGMDFNSAVRKAAVEVYTKDGVTNWVKVNETVAYAGKIQKAGGGGGLSDAELKAQKSAEISPYKPLEDPDATDEDLIVGQSVDENTVAFLEGVGQNLQIDAGLDAVPWYEDAGLLVGNPRLKGVPTPVAFQVRLTPTGSQMLHSPDGAAIEIRLNTSIRSMEIGMRHIVNHTPTRTGVHVTLWGMQPDIISGRGTTGLMMNQFGVTQFMSTDSFSGDIRNTVMAAYQQSSRKVIAKPSSRSPVTALAGKIENAANAIKPRSQQQAQQASFDDGALRVAAEDAFQELLALFKNNGVVRFHPQNYNGSMSEQYGVNTWSPKLGTSSLQVNARNNDVLTRGSVVFRYRNSTYFGYFKTLTWVQDAEKPFQWTFDFVFQVEKTMSMVFLPSLG